MVREIILSLDGSKATPVGDISADMQKSTVDIHLPFITKTINLSFENDCFSDKQKLAEVSSIFKKKSDDLDNENYRSVIILPHVLKAFERIMYMQIDNFMRDKLLKLLTGFSKNHNTQHYMMSMLCCYGPFRVFDILKHNLLTAKLGAYGFERDSISFMKSY